MKALITRKLGMTSIISEDGTVAAVTLLSAPENVITQIKSEETDGYSALQLGFEQVSKQTKTQKGHTKKANMPAKVMREIRVDDLAEYKVGDKISADLFNSGDAVKVTSISKGKGFAGAIKRHNFRSQRQTHGANAATRRVGSIGSMYPQKIFKGKKMAGHLGNAQTSVKNLKVAVVYKEKSVIGVFGAVPGPRKSVVIVRGA